MVWAVDSKMGEIQESGGLVSAVKVIPPLEVAVWAPLDDQASGSKVAGRREARVVAKIRRCLTG